jgi:hypothetical protein
MTIDFVKKSLNRYLNYAKAPNNGFKARDCYNVAFGMAHMAACIAYEYGNGELGKEIETLWDDTYRDLFLQAYYAELTQQ